MENMEEDDLYEAVSPPDPVQHQISGDGVSDTHQQQELSFKLVLKKKNSETECHDTGLDYAVKYRKKYHRSCSSMNIAGSSVDTTKELSSKRKLEDYLAVSESKPLFVTTPILNSKDFEPVQLIDINCYKYCSFCFTSNERIVHENGNCPMEDFPRFPSSYWPSGWPGVKFLFYKQAMCAVSGCQAEINDCLELMEHVKTCHAIDEDLVPKFSAMQDNSGPSEKFLVCKDDKTHKKKQNDVSHHSLLDIESCNSFNKDDTMSKNSIRDSDCTIDLSTEASSQKDDLLVTFSGLQFDGDSSQFHARLNSNDETENSTCSNSNSITKNLPHLLNNETQQEILQDEPKTSPRKPYKCGLCHSTTPDVRNVMQHYLHSHKINKLYICHRCNFVSHLKTSLFKHWSRFHYANDTLPNPVIVAEELFDESVMTKKGYIKLSAEAELRNSTMEDSTSIIPDHNLENYNGFLLKKLSRHISCKLCDYSTKILGHIRHHIVVKHITTVSETLINLVEDTTKYRCVTCKAVRDTKAAMATHYVGEHLKAKKLKCDLCDKSVCDASQFKKHCVSDRHTDFYRRSLRCKQCLFATLSKVKLQKHAKEHALQSDFKCTKCDYQAKLKGSIKEHIALVHDFKIPKNEAGLYLCEKEDCGFATRTKKDIYRHMETNHRVKEKRVFKKSNAAEVDDCKSKKNESDNLFDSSSEASTEVHAAENDDDLRCTKCDYVCRPNHKGDLKRHVFWSHECKKREDGLYSCEKEGCNFSTKVKQDLYHHSMVGHPTNKLSSQSGTFSCYICDYVTTSSRYYEFHLQKRHKGM